MASVEVAAEQIREMIAKISGSTPTGAPATDPEPAPEPYAELEEMDYETYAEALDQVLSELNVPEEARQGAQDQLEAGDDYSPEGLMSHLADTVNDSSVSTHIEDSFHNTGTVHGNIHQVNETNVANATAEDSIAGRDQHGNFQSGDGQQIDGSNYGVANQGDNSGQQAGGYAEADNITTGDGNMVGSTGATVGNANVDLDGATIYANDSAVNIGSGEAAYDEDIEINASYDDHSTVDDHSNLSENIGIDHSGNSISEIYDNDPVTETFDLDVDVNDGHGDMDYEAGAIADVLDGLD